MLTYSDSEEIWTFEHLGHQLGHGTVGAVVVDTHGNLAAGLHLRNSVFPINSNLHIFISLQPLIFITLKF